MCKLLGDTYRWPNSAMMPEGQGFNLVISIVVSAAAGCVLAVSLSSAGGNALVGTAISAGLLPPLVNAGKNMIYKIYTLTQNVSVIKFRPCVSHSFFILHYHHHSLIRS